MADGSDDRDRTPAEVALANWYRQRLAAGAGGAGLTAARRTAFERFDEAGLPHRRVEAYKYSDLRARLRDLPAPAEHAATGEVAGVLAAVPPLEGIAPIRLVVANGRFNAAASDDVAGIAGLSIAPITDTDAVPADLGALARTSDDPLALLNTSLFEGGLAIEVAAGAAIDRPVEIVFVAAGAAPATQMPRCLVTIGAGAEVSILERHGAASVAGHVVNTLTELAVGEGAKVTFVKIEGDGPASVHFGSLFTRIADGARLEHLTTTFGGHAFARSQSFVEVAGAEAHASFATATIAVEERHADATLVVRHTAPGSESREFFRSVVGSGGRAVVQGQILVDQIAQKTDARMLSNALFLDDTGEAVNKPELEIFADDVQCGHGATSGELDAEMLFYLRSRGVPKRDAERMLVEAFLLEAVETVSREDLQGAVGKRLMDALHETEGKVSP